MTCVLRDVVEYYGGEVVPHIIVKRVPFAVTGHLLANVVILIIPYVLLMADVVIKITLRNVERNYPTLWSIETAKEKGK